MKKLYTYLGILFSAAILFSSCEELSDALGVTLTDAEMKEGLTEALDVGIQSSVTSASSVDGYLKNEIIKLLLPPEVQTLQNKINTGGINLGITTLSYSSILTTYAATTNNLSADPFNDLITAMNRGAESAASEAGSIFVTALTNMTISDALGILQGGETSATDYFLSATESELTLAFQPKIKNALDASSANAIYTDISGFLNYEYDTGIIGTVNLGSSLNVEIPATLDGYATDKAITGLFHLIGEEEKKIRASPLSYASAIIQKVFNSPEAQG